MCGIAGILASAGPRDLGADIRRMTAAIFYRGPDGHGHWTDPSGRIALGHRRLAVIDLSAAGAQPMSSHDGRWVLTYNGEIYNYRDIQKALERERQTDWRGHSDTEVLLEAISRWGLPKTLERVDGMFAIALWDRQDGELHLARDRFGEKPLYVAWDGSRLLFASELKAIHAACTSPRQVDPAGMEWLLALGYIPAPWSPFRDVFKLPAGRWISTRPGDPAPTDAAEFAEACIPFWSPLDVAEQAVASPRIESVSDAMAQVEQALEASVARRMLADVPLGAFLSGGIDSSLITTLMVKQSSRPVQTFTIGFYEHGYDESDHAARVADALGTDHHMQKLHVDDALALIPNLPDLYDEPLGDASQLPMLLLSRYARRHVTVCLSGDGGDELFFGYQRQFNALELWGPLSRVPRSVRALAAACFEQWGRWPGARRQRWRQAGFMRSDSAHELHLAMSRHWSGPGEQPGFLRGLHGPALDSIDNMRLFDQRAYLPDDLMPKSDRAAMSVGLETRMPFLEPALVELSWRLPPSMLYRDGQGKWLLRELLSRHLSADIVARPKQGFGVPMDAWLRNELRGWATSLLEFARESAPYVDVPALQAMWRQHLSGARDCGDPLWTVLTMLNWLRAQGDSVDRT